MEILKPNELKEKFTDPWIAPYQKVLTMVDGDKVQLINAVDMWKPLRKSLGKKRREIDRDSITKITQLYADFEENEYSKIFPKEEFMYA